MSVSSSIYTPSISLQDLCTQCWANICARAKSSSQNPFVIRVCKSVVSEVYPVIPTKSHKCVILAVSLFMTVLGTSPLSSKTAFAVYDHVSISNSKQSSHGFSGKLALIIFLPELFSSSPLVPSAAFCHGEYGSVRLTWQSACLAL